MEQLENVELHNILKNVLSLHGTKTTKDLNTVNNGILQNKEDDNETEEKVFSDAQQVMLLSLECTEVEPQ